MVSFAGKATGKNIQHNAVLVLRVRFRGLFRIRAKLPFSYTSLSAFITWYARLRQHTVNHFVKSVIHE